MVFNLHDYVHSGIKDLDCLIGGGFPYGTITLIEEDEFACFSNLIIDCILSNQLHEKVPTLLSLTGSMKKADCIMNLPLRMERKLKLEYELTGFHVGIRKTTKPGPEDQIRNSTKNYCFDIKRKIKPEMCAERSMLDNLEIIKHSQLISDDFFLRLKTQDQSKLVIIVQSLLSVIDNIDYADDFCVILQKLKSLARINPRLCFIVTANTNYLEYAKRHYSINLVDCCLKLRRMEENEPLYHEFKGIMRFEKLFKYNAINYLVSPEVVEVGLQLKSLKRFFFIKKLEESPDDQRNLSRCSFDSEF